MDEATAIQNAESGAILHYKYLFVDPPLDKLILYVWISLFGDSEFSIRFPSVIFGLLSVFMIYKTGSLVFDREVGIVGSLLLGLSVFHIQYSQEARMYSLMAFLSLLSMYFFLKLLKNTNRRTLLAYFLSSISLLFAHTFGLFIIIAQNIYVLTLSLFSRQKSFDIKKWFLAQAIVFMPILLSTGYLIERLFRFKRFSAWWIPKPSALSLFVSFLEYCGSIEVFLIFIILVCFSVVVYERSKNKIDWRDIFKSLEALRWNVHLGNVKEVYFLLLWLLTPISALFIVSKFLFPVYWTRYTIEASLALYLLAAKGIKNITHKFLKSIILCIVITFLSVNIYIYYRETNKERWREAAEFVDKNAREGDLLLFSPDVSMAPFSYYSKKGASMKKCTFLHVYENAEEKRVKKMILRLLPFRRIWVIFSHVNDPRGLIKSAFGEFYNISYHKEYVSTRYLNIKFHYLINYKYIGIDLYLFEKK